MCLNTLQYVPKDFSNTLIVIAACVGAFIIIISNTMTLRDIRDIRDIRDL